MEIQPAIDSINIEDQNTQKEADIPGGKEKKYELVIEIRKMVGSPEIASQKSVVSTRLRTRSENGMKKPTLLR